MPNLAVPVRKGVLAYDRRQLAAQICCLSDRRGRLTHPVISPACGRADNVLLNVVGGSLVVGGDGEGEVRVTLEGVADVLDTLHHRRDVVLVPQVRVLSHVRLHVAINRHAAARRHAPAEILAHDHGV